MTHRGSAPAYLGTFSVLIVSALSGCTAGPPLTPVPTAVARPAAVKAASPPPSGVVPASFKADKLPPALSLDDLVALSVERNPRLRRAAFGVDVASGRAVQAGLYPNPTISFQGEEMGSREGPGGILTVPLVTQQVVTGGKLTLSKAAATREVDQATLSLLQERYVLLTTVRQGYYEVLTLQRRVELLGELVRLASESVETTKKLLEAKQVAKLDVLQLQVEQNRLRADEDAARQELAAAFRRLAANMGVPDLPITPLAGTLDAAPPEYDYDQVRHAVLNVHPQLRSAQVGVHRAQLLLRRAQADPIPNVTVGAGYTRNNQARGDEWTFQVGLPVPLWNRNQGNIYAARAEVGQAVTQVDQVANDLVGQVATAYGNYAAARQRAERYRTSILPDARETYTLALRAYQGGQFEYLRVLQAQRAVAEANLEYNRLLGEEWRSASEIAGLLLEDHWPAGRVGPAANPPGALPPPRPVDRPPPKP